MPLLSKLRQARQDLLAHISLIEEMRRGSVTRQFLKTRIKGKSEPNLTGPYALFSLPSKKKGGPWGADSTTQMKSDVWNTKWKTSISFKLSAASWWRLGNKFVG